jgi:hypothetical protein
MLGVAVGLFALSMSGQSQVPPSQIVAKPNFLSNITEGETIIITNSRQGEGISIEIVSEEELTKRGGTERERRLYVEVQQFLGEQRTGKANDTEMSEELKQLIEKHKSLENFYQSMQEKMRIWSRKVSRVGDDFIAYPIEGNREIILPLHRILSITRPRQK